MSNQLKLLIAEDYEEFNRDGSEVLNEYAMETTFVPKDGIKLLESIEEIKPDVVLLDLFMPGVDAIGVIKAVSKNVNVKTPTFIVLSSFDSPTLEKEAMKSGASYFVLKPFNIRDLMDRVMNLAMRESFHEEKTFTQQPTFGCSPTMEVKVTDILHQIGVPAHIKGYHYLRDSIIMSVENPDIINAVTKQLYPSVAKRFSTTSSRVERAIRHAIEVAWDRGDVDILNSYFGYTIHNGRGKPTNSEFIAMISDKLRLQMRSAS